MRRDALETRANRGMRAYVTGSDDARAKRDGGNLGVGSDEGRRRLRCSTGARPLRWQRSGGGWRDGPRRSTGTREGSTRTDSRDAPATLTLVDVPLHVWRGAVRCYGPVVRSRPEERNNVARSSEGQAFTTGMNAWPSLSGACAGPNMAICGTTSPRMPTINFDRRIDGHYCSVVDALRRRL